MATHTGSQMEYDGGTGLKHFFFDTKSIQRLHWEDTSADHLVTHEKPVILTGTNVVTPALRWTLPYLEENMGSSKHTVYLSKSHTFMYYDEKKVIHWGPTAEIEAYIKKQYKLEEMDTCYMLCSSILQQITSEYSKTTSVLVCYAMLCSTILQQIRVFLLLQFFVTLRLQVSAFPDFREPMRKREWTFSKFVDELKSHMGCKDEYIYYQDALTDTVGTSIKHDFLHFNWKWLNDRRQRYNWGQLTTNLLLISQPGNITPCHYDEQHNYFCQVMGEKRCLLFSPANYSKLYPYPVAHPCDRQSQVDFENPDFQKFPAFCDVEAYECIVKPGDVLYIPMYWWHYIESLPKGGVTMSLTFWYKGGPVPSKITYPLNEQQKVAITRNIEKMLHEALQDPAEVGPLLHMIVDGRY